MKVYDWIVVGSGIAGITIAEILSREGFSVSVLEKNPQLASETSKVFHEWLHTGSLYTLFPDKLLTLRYLLGAIDDIFEFYSSFPSMNLIPQTEGFLVDSDGWFNEEKIHFKYRNRKLNPIWLSIVSRSQNLLEMINQHDWLRRRAGSCYGSSEVKFMARFEKIPKLLADKKKFSEIISPDITMNSRVILHDLYSVCMNRGVSFINNCEVLSTLQLKNKVEVVTSQGNFIARNVVICAPDFNSSCFNLPLKRSFAPIAVIDSVPEEMPSFVELDYFTKTCINLIKKPDGIAQAGGISMSSQKRADEYIEYVIAQHRKLIPNMNVLGVYTGIKKELTIKGNNRNYLYHTIKQSHNVWSVVLGKFTLAFSLAPEFYRQVYKKNPMKVMADSDINKIYNEQISSNLIAKTSWQEVYEASFLS